jgi:hypothetical protein
LPCRFRCRSRGALLPHHFTLTALSAQVDGGGSGLFSVALSLGSPPPEVIRHRMSMEPGLSSPATFRSLPERPVVLNLLSQVGHLAGVFTLTAQVYRVDSRRGRPKDGCVFSLGWGLPPSWGCIPEQPDSGGRRRPIPVKGPPGPPATSRTGLSPSAAPRPRGFREAVGGDPHDDDLRGYNSGRLPAPGFGAWAPPASLAATEGITVVFFSSAY